MKNGFFIIPLFLLIFILSASNSYGQQSNLSDSTTMPSLKKNVIHATGGTLVLYAIANGSYERMIIDRRNKLISSVWVRATAGVWGAWTQGGEQYELGFTALTGSKNSHLEAHLGVNSFFDRQGYKDDTMYGTLGDPDFSKSNYWEFTPSGSLGYRFQKPGGHFMFRVGFGWPESAFLGLGFCF